MNRTIKAFVYVTIGLWCFGSTGFAIPITETIEIDFDGENLTVELQPFSLRSTVEGKAFSLRYQDSDGDLITVTNPAAASTYLGEVINNEAYSSSVVCGHLSDATNFNGSIFLDRGLRHTIEDNIVDMVNPNGVNYVPFFDLPNEDTVPATDARTASAFVLGVDVMYSNLQRAEDPTDPDSAMEFVESILINVATMFFRDTKTIPLIGPVILRLDEDECPYSGLEKAVKRENMFAQWPLVEGQDWDVLFACINLGSSMDRYAAATTFYMTTAHEMCHSLRCGESGNISPTDAPFDVAEGGGIMGGGTISKPNLTGKLARFNSHIPQLLYLARQTRPDEYTDLGNALDEFTFPPYAAMDVYVISPEEVGPGSYEMDPLANDFDCDNDAIELVGFDPISNRGGTVYESEGLLYYRPKPGVVGLDYFYYDIEDSNGKAASGLINISLQNSYTIYQAEDATPNRNTVVTNAITETTAWSGAGFVQMRDNDTPLDFNIAVAADGIYTLKCRQTRGKVAQVVDVIITNDDTGAQQEFASQFHFVRQQYQWLEEHLCTVSLTEGNYTVSIQNTDSRTYIDYLMVAEGTDIRVSFQPEGDNITSDRGDTGHEYLSDNGQPYGFQLSGRNYGWNNNLTNDLTRMTKPRNTTNFWYYAQWHMDSHIAVEPESKWEMDLANGFYHVHLWTGTLKDSLNDFLIEGVSARDTNPTNMYMIHEYTVEVTDGNLTIEADSTATNATMSYLWINNVEQSLLSSDNFDADLGTWPDGSGVRHTGGYTDADSAGSLMLVGGTAQTSSALAASAYAELRVDFWYKGRGMDRGEYLTLEVSTDGGITFTEVETWTKDIQFDNLVGYKTSAIITDAVVSGGDIMNELVLTDQTKLRFSNRANGAKDRVYVDGVKVYGLGTARANVLPMAQAGNDKAVTDEDGSGFEAVRLRARNSFDPDGDLVSYSWTVGAQVVGRKKTSRYNAPVGTTTVTLTVTDDRGEVDTDTIDVTVFPSQ